MFFSTISFDFVLFSRYWLFLFPVWQFKVFSHLLHLTPNKIRNRLFKFFEITICHTHPADTPLTSVANRQIPLILFLSFCVFYFIFSRRNSFITNLFPFLNKLFQSARICWIVFSILSLKKKRKCPKVPRL